jgi:hypothetical protein
MEKNSYIFREGNRKVEVVAGSYGDAVQMLPALVRRKYPSDRQDYWVAFVYCGTMPA